MSEDESIGLVLSQIEKATRAQSRGRSLSQKRYAEGAKATKRDIVCETTPKPNTTEEKRTIKKQKAD